MKNEFILLQSVILRILRSFTILLIAGGVIGLLHHEDGIVAGFLAVTGFVIFWFIGRQQSMSGKIIFISGMALTGFLGVRVEIWGIENGYWIYHDLSEGRVFPYWLTPAWMCAFAFLYRVELHFIKLLQLTDLKQKILLATIISVVLPTWGEIITISLGVWTYTWGFQLFGVPLLAIFLLAVNHMVIFVFFTFVCRAFGVEDLVFGYTKVDIRSQKKQYD